MIRLVFISQFITVILFAGFNRTFESENVDLVVSVKNAVTLRVFATSGHVPLNKTILYIIEVEWEDNNNQFEFNWPTKPVNSRLEIVGYATSNKRKIKGEMVYSVKTFEYTLQALEQGKIKLPQIRMEYKNVRTNTNHMLYIPPYFLTIIEPENSKKSITPLFSMLAGIGGIGVVVLFGYILIKRKRHTPQENIVMRQMPETTTLGALREHDRLIIAGEYKEYGAAITRSIRAYVSEKYDIDVSKSSTEEIMHVLKNADFEEKGKQDIIEILRYADKLKFSISDPDRNELEILQTLLNQFVAKLELENKNLT